MRLRTIFRLWLPLAVSFELMMLEGPAVQGAIGRLPNSPLNLAAWGLAISLSLLIESPVIMLLATAITLVKDTTSYRALRRFMLSLCLGCTLLSGLVAFTPLLDLVAGRLMGQPPAIVRMARPAMQIMLFWTAAIGWRRFYQGILVRNGLTRFVSLGTTFRLLAIVLTVVILASWGRLAGVQVAACGLMAGVLTEALATTTFILPLVRCQLSASDTAAETPLTQHDIRRFHMPLAATTVLTLLAHPMTSAALARLAMPKLTLAAWPVAFMALLVIRGWGLALQEITVAQARDSASAPVLRRFAVQIGLATSGFTLLLVTTPLLSLYFQNVLHLPRELQPYTRLGIAACLLLPLITALGSWARGVLMAGGGSRAVYRGMALNLSTHGLLLLTGVLLRLPGMWVGAGAFSLAALTEYLYLLWCVNAAEVPMSAFHSQVETTV
jgi:progressive ankylosis protein